MQEHVLQLDVVAAMKQRAHQSTFETSWRRTPSEEDASTPSAPRTACGTTLAALSMFVWMSETEAAVIANDLDRLAEPCWIPAKLRLVNRERYAGLEMGVNARSDVTTMKQS